MRSISHQSSLDDSVELLPNIELGLFRIFSRFELSVFDRRFEHEEKLYGSIESAGRPQGWDWKSIGKRRMAGMGATFSRPVMTTRSLQIGQEYSTYGRFLRSVFHRLA